MTALGWAWWGGWAVVVVLLGTLALEVWVWRVAVKRHREAEVGLRRVQLELDQAATAYVRHHDERTDDAAKWCTGPDGKPLRLCSKGHLPGWCSCPRA